MSLCRERNPKLVGPFFLTFFFYYYFYYNGGNGEGSQKQCRFVLSSNGNSENHNVSNKIEKLRLFFYTLSAPRLPYKQTTDLIPITQQNKFWEIRFLNWLSNLHKINHVYPRFKKTPPHSFPTSDSILLKTTFYLILINTFLLIIIKYVIRVPKYWK